MSDPNIQGLDEILNVATILNKTRQEYAESMVQFEKDIAALQENLEATMILAVDKYGQSAKVVAKIAGYKNHASIRDARKRVEARNAEIWKSPIS